MRTRGGTIALGFGLCAWISVSTTGCGILLQTAFGWSETERRVTSQIHEVEIATFPPNAVVTRHSSRGPELLGPAPVFDTHAVETEIVETQPKAWGLWAGGLGEITASLALFLLGGLQMGSSGDDLSASTSTGFSDGPIKLMLGATAFLLAGSTDLCVGLVHSTFGGDFEKNILESAPEYTYTASLPGRADARRTPHGERGKLELRLGELPAAAIAREAAEASRSAALVSTSPSAQGEPSRLSRGPRLDARSVVAVMPVGSASGRDVRGPLDPDLVSSLGQQLRVFLARERVRVTDLGAEDRLLRARIEELKSESYRSCYDESCQIELGKALAASHILRSNIARFGNVCVLNGELIELASEVSVAAASAQGPCEAEGFLRMGEAVAIRLARD